MVTLEDRIANIEVQLTCLKTSIDKLVAAQEIKDRESSVDAIYAARAARSVIDHFKKCDRPQNPYTQNS